MPKINQIPILEIDINRFFVDNGNSYFANAIDALRSALKLFPKKNINDPLGGTIYWPELHHNNNAVPILVNLTLPKKQNLWLKINTQNAYIIEYGYEENGNIIFNKITEVQYPKTDGVLENFVYKLDRGTFIKSLSNLMNKRTEKFSWISIALVFCESARFDSVKEAMMKKMVDTKLISKNHTNILAWMIRNWSDLASRKDASNDYIKSLLEKNASNLNSEESPSFNP